MKASMGGKSGGTRGKITTKIPTPVNVRSLKGAKTMPMGPEIKSVDEVLGMSSERMKENPPWSCDDKQMTSRPLGPKVEHD